MTTPQPRGMSKTLTLCNCNTVGTVLGHFGHGPYGLDISAMENAEGGHFRAAITINLGLGCMHAQMCDALINLLKSNMHVNTFSRLKNA